MNNSEPTTRKRFYCNKNENEFDLFSMDDTTEAISEAISKALLPSLPYRFRGFLINTIVLLFAMETCT